jgi:hypothetical protein
MTPRKRFRLLISVLGGTIGAVGITIVLLAAQAIEQALGPQETVVIQPIDATPKAEFDGLERRHPYIHNDSHIVSQGEHPATRY